MNRALRIHRYIWIATASGRIDQGAFKSMMRDPEEMFELTRAQYVIAGLRFTAIVALVFALVVMS